MKTIYPKVGLCVEFDGEQWFIVNMRYEYNAGVGDERTHIDLETDDGSKATCFLEDLEGCPLWKPQTR